MILVRKGEQHGGGVVTFSSMALYNAWKQYDTEAKLMSPNFVPEKLTKVVQAKIIKKDLTENQEEKQIKQAEKFDTSKYSTSKFRAEIYDFTVEQLELFAKDKRKTISKEAKQLIKKLT